jgi:hypothetical protein
MDFLTVLGLNSGLCTCWADALPLELWAQTMDVFYLCLFLHHKQIFIL